MTTEFRNCAAETSLSDTEIAQIIRSVAVNDGAALNLFAVGTSATCQLERVHGGDCGGWVATIGPDTEETDARNCWLRWGDARRTLAWLHDCPVNGLLGCLLYEGHPGECAPGPGFPIPGFGAGTRTT